MIAPIITKSFAPMIGLPCWGLNFERMLNLSMNFGDPSLKIREPIDRPAKLEANRRNNARRLVTVKGEWWLWIYCSFWKIVANGKRLAAQSSSLRTIEKGMNNLQGQKLIAVDIRPDTGATRFAFDLGAELHCRRFERETEHDELWTLYKPSSFVLAVYGDGTYTHHRGSEDGPRKPIE